VTRDTILRHAGILVVSESREWIKKFCNILPTSDPKDKIPETKLTGKYLTLKSVPCAVDGIALPIPGIIKTK
jgi:hypothetical protein